MKAVKFSQVNARIGSSQEEYNTLPAHVDPKGTVTCCFEFSDDEVEIIQKTKKIWFMQLTFMNPFQPVRLGVNHPFNLESHDSDSAEK